MGICGIVSYQFSCLLLVTQKVNNKNVQVLNVLKFEVIFSLKGGTSILVEKVTTLLTARNCLFYIYIHIYLYIYLYVYIYGASQVVLVVNNLMFI